MTNKIKNTFNAITTQTLHLSTTIGNGLQAAWQSTRNSATNAWQFFRAQAMNLWQALSNNASSIYSWVRRRETAAMTTATQAQTLSTTQDLLTQMTKPINWLYQQASANMPSNTSTATPTVEAVVSNTSRTILR